MRLAVSVGAARLFVRKLPGTDTPRLTCPGRKLEEKSKQKSTLL